MKVFAAIKISYHNNLCKLQKQTLSQQCLSGKKLMSK